MVGAIMARGDAEPDRDDVPEGIGDLAIEATRTDDALTILVPGDRSDQARVSVCPGLLPGPSDVPGLLERIRVSGCVAATRDPSAGDDVWTLPFSALDAELIVTFDAAQRWLAVVVEPARGADDAGRVEGAWIAGGPLLPTGPLLP